VGPSNLAAGLLSVGTATTSDRTLLPQSLLDSLLHRPTPQRVLLGSTPAYRYPGLVTTASGAAATAYVLATNKGHVVLAICSPSTRVAGLEGMCETVIGSLRLTMGRLLNPGPSATYGAGFAAIVRRLNQATQKGQTELTSAHTPQVQAKAARKLADRVKASAADLKKLRPGPAESHAARTLEQALTSLGEDYNRLSHAAFTHNASQYGAARDAVVAADGKLKAPMQTFSDLGYRAN
jgi:hypothetical protein